MLKFIKKIKEAINRFFKFIFKTQKENVEKRGRSNKKKVSLNLSLWSLDIIDCIEELDKKRFTLQEMYDFQEQLKEKHPENNHIQAKIRQELQKLRDNGYLEFIDNQGNYKVNYYFDDNYEV